MPNPNLLKTAVRLTEKRFEIQNRLLAPFTEQRGDGLLYILKRDGTVGKKFKVLAIISNYGMDTETGQFRNRPFLEVAKSENTFGANQDKSFGEILGSASHVATVPNGELYSIREGDEVQVQQTDFTYRIFGQLTGQKFNKETDV